MATDKHSDWLENRREEIQTAGYSEDCKEAILTFLDAYNPQAMHIKPPIVDGKDAREDTLATASRLAYASTLHRTATSLDLTTCTAVELNRHAGERLNGLHESVSDDGITPNTVHQNQIAWRSFARFHGTHPKGLDIQLDADEIVLVDREDSTVDERDMFTSEEIEAMRQACRNKRDRALLEMLIYTGQRHNALRLLKYKDVKPDEGESGVIYLPKNTEGLKGASGKRPLLGAQEPVRDWKNAHPTKEPEDAFLTHIYDWDGHEHIELGDHLSHNGMGNIPKRVANRADVDKPANPHNFRHFFVTMAIGKHNMSMDTVRHLIGHAPDSRELERTYQHLVDDDYIENAELSSGHREQREESLTPSTCFTCNYPLEPGWSRCPQCGRKYGPTEDDVEGEIEKRKTEGALAATGETEQTKARELIEELDNDALVDQIIAAFDSTDQSSLDEAFSSK